MSYIKGDNPREQKMFDFLEDLRQSGDTNMFGAGIYLERAFHLSKTEATPILSRWMHLHSDKTRIVDGPATKTKKTVRFRTVVETSEEERT